MATPPPFTTPTPSEIRDAILRVDRTALIARGVANPNVTQGSDYWIRAESLSQQLAVLYANQVVKADQQMPDTATGDDLTRILAIFGISPLGAQPSAGNIVINCSVATFVAAGTELIDSEGQTYQVTVGATYNNGDSIPIEAISTGLGTNHEQGDVLQWVSTPAYTDPKALIGVGGLIGGADQDNDETSRNRLYTFLRNPPAAGNWTQVANWATTASASVQAAYVYPALNGPGTVGVCVVGPLSYDSTHGWTREVSTAVLNAVAARVGALAPEHWDIVVKTPADTGGSTPAVDTDVAIGLSLPAAVTGGGPGGGWLDATPWPQIEGAATRVYVSVATDSTHITITSNDAANCPSSTALIVGETQVAWFSATQYAAGEDPVVVATVTAVSGSTGALTITLSKPFTGVAAGDFIFPASENVQAYARAFLEGMNQMGPGQWTTNASVLVRAKRRPIVTSSNPSDFTSTLLRAISDSGEEVLDVDYLYKSVVTPGVPGNTTTLSPFILVPRRFGFYDHIA